MNDVQGLYEAIISTHTPLAGRDASETQTIGAKNHFYSHAPRGARHTFIYRIGSIVEISTHTPLAGRDYCD